MDNGLLLAILAGVFYVLVLPGLVIFALVRLARLNQELADLRQAQRALLARLTQLMPQTDPRPDPRIVPSEAPAVILSEAKDPAVLPSCLLVARITGADIARTIYRRVLRFAQDDRDGGDSIRR
jgi:hypothetical protein